MRFLWGRIVVVFAKSVKADFAGRESEMYGARGSGTIEQLEPGLRLDARTVGGDNRTEMYEPLADHN